MTFFLRKSAFNVRNVNRFRKLYALGNIPRATTFGTQNEKIESSNRVLAGIRADFIARHKTRTNFTNPPTLSNSPEEDLVNDDEFIKLTKKESHRYYNIKTNKLKPCFLGVNNKWSLFHTSPPCNGTVAFKLSDIGEGIREVVIKEWFVKVGDKVQQFDKICEVQSDKASVTITSRYDGVITKLYHEIDQTALVGNPLADIEVENSGNEDHSSNSNEKAASPTTTSTYTTTSTNLNKTSTSPKAKVLTTPAVRRIAAQFNVDIHEIQGTGRGGRVSKADVLSYLNIDSDTSNDVRASAVLAEDRSMPISGFTRAMVKSMTEAMKIPHFGLSDEYDVSKLVECRETLKSKAYEKGVRLTYLPIILKAASLSLHSFPILNSSLDNSCERLTLKSSHNIGVAMDTPSGLIVPVIKDVQKKSIFQIAQELNNLQEKGRNNQLGVDDLAGGTFTISNIGNIGGTYTKPIILPPQVAIGALGKIQVLPRFDSNGDLVKAHVMTVSWSADHRVIDGVTMTRYSNQLKSYLENPHNLILDL